MSSESYVKVRHLEEAVNFIENQNENLLKFLQNSDFELQNLSNHLETEILKGRDLEHEIQTSLLLEEKSKQLAFEIEKAEKEREFHINQHAETRKKIYNRQNSDFQISSIKKELNFKSEEVENLKIKVETAKNEIEQLLIFGERPQEEKKGQIETFYAKKIVELESTVKALTEERNSLEGKKNSQANEPRKFQYEQSKTLQIENDILRKKIEDFNQENFGLKTELEKLKIHGFSEKVREISDEEIKTRTQKYKDKIAKLRQENISLSKKIAKSQKVGQPENVEHSKKVNEITLEKKLFIQNIENLTHEIEIKKAEIEAINLESSDSEALQKLIDANKRMSAEIFKLQEQLRKVESFSRDSMLNSLNH